MWYLCYYHAQFARFLFSFLSTCRLCPNGKDSLTETIEKMTAGINIYLFLCKSHLHHHVIVSFSD